MAVPRTGSAQLRISMGILLPGSVDAIVANRISEVAPRSDAIHPSVLGLPALGAGACRCQAPKTRRI